MTVIVLLEVLALLALAAHVARRTPPAEPPYGRRLLRIGALLGAQVLVLYLFEFQVFASVWARDAGSVYGLAWLTQAIRAGLLLAALRLWFGIARSDLRKRWLWILLGVGLVGMLRGGPFAFPGFGALIWLSFRLSWSRELGTGPRVIALLVSPILFLALSWFPVVSTEGGAIDVIKSGSSELWPPPLVSGLAPTPLERELALARPLDRAVLAIIELFRAQLVVLFIRALTLPIRLRGSSLKRRFTLNFVLVRQIPALIGILTVTACAYIAFGVIRSGQVRAAFDRTLTVGSAVGAALLADPEVTSGEAAGERLSAARSWLGASGDRAHVLLRAWDPARRDSASADSASYSGVVMAGTAGAPSSLAEARVPHTPDGRFEGVVQVGDAVFLLSRALTPDTTRALDVFVSLDSLYLGEVARRVGARIRVDVEPTVSVDTVGLRFGGEPAPLRPVIITSGTGTTSGRSFHLARSLLPYGDWRSGWAGSDGGAISVRLFATRVLFFQALRDVPGWLFSNVFTVGLLLILAFLTGTTESLAVRSGRSIVQSVLDEVGQLREAAARFGAGDLAHRVPVRGRDELSSLAGSFNEMAESLERQRAELIEKERIEEDLEVARQIQRRLLPQAAPVVPGLEVAGLSVPSLEVGGDLYYYTEIAGPSLAVALGDVSGKSVPAALLMSNVMSALRTEVQHETDVSRSLERLNRLIIEQIEPGRFVTLFYGVIEPGADAVRYTSAGHNPPLLLGADGREEWLREGGMPLGFQTSAAYPMARAAFRPGDLLVVYSDGVTEAERPGAGEEAELFGDERLLACVRALRGRSAEAVVQGILAAVEGFVGEHPQADDITLVAARRT